jgi:hypothetical protein
MTNLSIPLSDVIDDHIELEPEGGDEKPKKSSKNSSFGFQSIKKVNLKEPVILFISALISQSIPVEKIPLQLLRFVSEPIFRSLIIVLLFFILRFGIKNLF